LSIVVRVRTTSNLSSYPRLRAPIRMQPTLLWVYVRRGELPLGAHLLIAIAILDFERLDDAPYEPKYN